MCDLNKKNLLREVTVKIGLERIDMQEGITVEALLDSGATRCHIQVHPSRNYISMVKSPLKNTSLPSMAAIFLATHLMVVLQPSGYSVFHGGDTPIQLSLS